MHAETAGVVSEKPVGVVPAIYILVYVDALEFLDRGNTLRGDATISIIIDIRKYIENISTSYISN